MKKIILNSGLTIYQKVMVTLAFLASLWIGINLLLAFLLKTFGNSEFDQEFNGTIYLFLLFLPLSFFLFLLLFSKDGLLISDEKKLYKAKFFLKRNWFKQKIDLDNITDITILSKKGTLHYAPFTFSMPDKKYEEYVHEIYLLNKNHTLKIYLITVGNKESAEKTISEINKVFNFNFEPYNPRFYD